MLLPRLSGTWIGEYRFTEWQGAGNFPDRVVPFSMTLERRGVSGLQGSFQEDRDLGIPEPSTLSGRRCLHRVFFTKEVRQLYFFMPDGRIVTFGQWYEEHYGQEYLNWLPHPPIEYEGRLRQRGTVLTGRWQIRASALESEHGDWRLDLPRVAGTWEARRANESPDARRHLQ